MTRRIALAISLALTVITTFSVVVVGARTGLFGGGDGAEAGQEVAAPLPTATVAVAVTEAADPSVSRAPDPVYVTEYVYIDAPAAAAQPRQQAGATKITAAPTIPPAEQPTQPAPAANPQPTTAATPVPPVPTAAVPPAVNAPTSTPVATAPKAELEFTGTVTAISGDMVTFSHGGVATVVKVTQGLSNLQAGESVKVHAIWISAGYYVAKEIEYGEGE